MRDEGFSVVYKESRTLTRTRLQTSLSGSGTRPSVLGRTRLHPLSRNDVRLQRQEVASAPYVSESHTSTHPHLSLGPPDTRPSYVYHSQLALKPLSAAKTISRHTRHVPCTREDYKGLPRMREPRQRGGRRCRQRRRLMVEVTEVEIGEAQEERGSRVLRV